MWKNLRNLCILAAVAALTAVSAAGCNTLRGMGKDIEQGGKKLQQVGD